METWQVRVCPFDAKSDRTIRIHTGMKMGLWPWNPAFISLLLQRSMKGLKQLKWTRPTVAAAGTGCESQFFSEQSARAIQSLHFNLEPKPPLLLVYDVCQTRRRRKKKHAGEGGRRALTAWKEQSHQLNFSIIWNVLELAETMAGLMTLGVCHLLLESDFPGKRASSLGMSHASQASQPRRGRLDEEDWWGCAWTWRRPHPECQTRRAVELLMPCPYVCLHRADNEITLLCLWGKATNIYSILNCSSYISLRLSNSVDPSAEDCWFR